MKLTFREMQVIVEALGNRIAIFESYHQTKETYTETDDNGEEYENWEYRFVKEKLEPKDYDEWKEMNDVYNKLRETAF